MMLTERQNEAAAQWLSERTGQTWVIVEDGMLYSPALECEQTGDSRPVFSDSLDSMALLQAQLNSDEVSAYRLKLLIIYGHSEIISFGDERLSMDWFYINATPTQRLEAFLRAVNLWESE